MPYIVGDMVQVVKIEGNQIKPVTGPLLVTSVETIQLYVPPGSELEEQWETSYTKLTAVDPETKTQYFSRAESFIPLVHRGIAITLCEYPDSYSVRHKELQYETHIPDAHNPGYNLFASGPVDWVLSKIDWYTSERYKE